MKTKVNSPIASKINYTAFAMVAINLLAIFELLPAEYEGLVTQLVTGLLMPVMVVVWRTWFTEPGA
jgi:hypothetical protein